MREGKGPSPPQKKILAPPLYFASTGEGKGGEKKTEGGKGEREEILREGKET